MTTDRATTTTPVRRRPRDRKAQIVRVAANAFGERGYHAVGVDEIAAEIGISGPALYRHFPNKYALFVATADAIVDRLLAVTEAPQHLPDARDRLAATVHEIVAVTIDNRRSGGIYRWESRYLDDHDRERFRVLWDEVNQRVARPLHELRPRLPESDIAMLAAATLSVIASITVHRIALSAGRTEALIDGLARSVLECELPTAPTELAASTRHDGGLAVAAKRESLIAAALEIFDKRGYHEATIEEIGVVAGITASSVYRYFAGKAEILAAVFYRASERLAVATSDALGEAADPAAAMDNLVTRYVRLAFVNPALISVYFAEFGNLPARERSDLRALQSQHIEEWVHLLTAQFPGLGTVAARFRVHAALGLVLDVGRLIRFDNSPQSRARVATLMKTVLRAGAPASDAHPDDAATPTL
ncbi:TetR/AcrR family transcriptional regulator [Antrihabitans sp. YC3-6]|uniref:TetR/AcrR family transcriptional regulator n=1 Tax=Antrihabitans stalagmiti TaxID=2799499 RepID=A0A934NNZ3_9NOCA|nr:TetR/AcrR family transcriptional regulator [Antrihabitans stalagmiti]MBJ8338724.1 TetR/AcrR family transcriptional regulator [Antrihabitans stalagmiti]